MRKYLSTRQVDTLLSVRDPHLLQGLRAHPDICIGGPDALPDHDDSGGRTTLGWSRERISSELSGAPRRRPRPTQFLSQRNIAVLLGIAPTASLSGYTLPQADVLVGDPADGPRTTTRGWRTETIAAWIRERNQPAAATEFRSASAYARHLAKTGANPVRLLSTRQVAILLGLQESTSLANYELPPPVVVIGPEDGDNRTTTRGYDPEQIERWIQLIEASRSVRSNR